MSVEIVLVLLKSRSTGKLCEIRLTETEEKFVIEGTVQSNPYKEIHEEFDEYHNAIERWCEIIGKSEPAF